MNQKISGQKLLAFILLMAGAGWVYEYLSLETRTWILPMVILAAAGLLIGRLKQLEYETRAQTIKAYEIEARQVHLVDASGARLLSLSISAEGPAIVFYDQEEAARLTLELRHSEPLLELRGERGSAFVEFAEGGRPKLAFTDESGELLWSVP